MNATLMSNDQKNNTYSLIAICIGLAAAVLLAFVKAFGTEVNYLFWGGVLMASGLIVYLSLDGVSNKSNFYEKTAYSLLLVVGARVLYFFCFYLLFGEPDGMPFYFNLPPIVIAVSLLALIFERSVNVMIPLLAIPLLIGLNYCGDRGLVTEKKEIVFNVSKIEQVQKVETDVKKLLIAEGINTSVFKSDYNLSLENGVEKLEIDYQINSNRDSLYVELDSYEKGEYDIASSEATMILLKSVDVLINGFLKKVLNEGDEIKIDLLGFTDRTKYLSNSLYNGREGKFPKFEDEYDFAIKQYWRNGDPVNVFLEKDDELNNELLGFLRAFCMYDEYLRHDLTLRENSRKTRYQFFSQTNELDKGPEHRKSGIRIIVFNTNFNLPKPEPSPSPSPLLSCHWIFSFLYWVMLGFIGLFSYQLKKMFDFKEDKKENEVRHHRKYLLYWSGAALILALVIYFNCPDLLLLHLL